MKIHHIAIWTNNLEELKEFYEKYFKVTCNEKYINKKKGFSSYFLSFNNGARIEIMTINGLESRNDIARNSIGLAHIALSVGTKSLVDKLTEQIRHDGYTVLGEPRTTGDGYYESVILDPDGNKIELIE